MLSRLKPQVVWLSTTNWRCSNGGRDVADCGRRLQRRSLRTSAARCFAEKSDEPTPTMRVAASTLFTPEAVRQKMAQLEAKRKQQQVARKGKTTAAPEQLLYRSKTSGTFNAINTIFTLGAFPVHAWGFMTLADTTLLMFPLAFSLMWLYFSVKRANTTVRDLTLQEGHERLKITTFTLWGTSKEQTVGVDQVSPVFTESTEPLPTNNLVTSAQLAAMSALFSNKRVSFLDVYSLTSKNQWGKRVRYSIDYKSVTSPLLFQALWNFAVYASANTFDDRVVDVSATFANSADNAPANSEAPRLQR